MVNKNKVTLDDVARAVGVSAITVSRALHRPQMVSPDVRARVDSAVKRLGYVPNPAAQQLARGRSSVIGVVIPSVTNNVYAEVLRGVYEGVECTACDVQLANTRYSPSLEESILRVFHSQRPAGLIVTGFEQTEGSKALLRAMDCPVVQIMDIGEDPIDVSFGISHYEAARVATTHLIAAGYQRPGFIGARMDPRTQKRFAAFRETTQAAGCYDERRVVTTTQPSNAPVGAQLMADLMARAPDTDAVFCNNDDLAIGVLFEAQRRRIAVPQQFGICGFNDLEVAEAAEPPITSIRTPRFGMGQKAVALILARLRGETTEGPRCVDLGFSVQQRRSTRRDAPAPAR